MGRSKEVPTCRLASPRLQNSSAGGWPVREIARWKSRGAATLEDAEQGQISFLDSAEKAHRLADCRATALIVPADFVPERWPAIQATDVHRAFAAIVRHFHPQRRSPRVGISPLALVTCTARIGENVDIHPGAAVGDAVEIGGNSIIHSGVRLMAGCVLGRGVTIYPNAVLYENTIVGDRSIIHAGAVIGAYGFGYKLVGGQHRAFGAVGQRRDRLRRRNRRLHDHRSRHLFGHRHRRRHEDR